MGGDYSSCFRSEDPSDLAAVEALDGTNTSSMLPLLSQISMALLIVSDIRGSLSTSQ